MVILSFAAAPLDITLFFLFLQIIITFFSFSLYFRGRKKKRQNFFKAVYSMLHLSFAALIVIIIFFVTLPHQPPEDYFVGVQSFSRFLAKKGVIPEDLIKKTTTPPSPDIQENSNENELTDSPSTQEGGIIIEESDAEPSEENQI